MGGTLPPSANATIEGYVKDATTGSGIANAEVSWVWYGRKIKTARTEVDGYFQLDGLPEGELSFRVEKAGYTPLEEEVVLVADDTVYHEFFLSPALASGEWRIVLSWGENPSDLDSHLWTPADDHIYYSSKGNCDDTPWACLDHDDTNSYGPETITITKVLPGVYSYAVHWYSGTGSWAESDATVRVYNEAGLVQVFSVPEVVDEPDTSGKRWWYVFDFSNGVIAPKNQLSESSPR